jgi:hypothetical protein
MQDLIIEATIKTPEVRFIASNGLLTLRGRSIPENSIDFFKPLHDWIDGYFLNPQEKTCVEIKLEYFNTSSSKSMLDLFKKMEALNGIQTKIEINWFYEEDDEDMLEAGEDYQAILNIPVSMIAVDEL